MFYLVRMRCEELSVGGFNPRGRFMTMFRGSQRHTTMEKCQLNAIGTCSKGKRLGKVGTDRLRIRFWLSGCFVRPLGYRRVALFFEGKSRVE